MKKLSLVAFVIVLILSLMLAGATMAQGDIQYVCYYSGLGDLPQDVVMRSVVYDPVSGAVYFERTVNGGQSDPYNAIMPVLVPITAQEDIYLDGFGPFSYSAASPFLQFPMTDCVGVRIGDGRINDGPNELGAPLAAYCADGDIEVWDINLDAQGTLGFTASASAIDAALSEADSSGLPTLVDSGLGNSLYASLDGQLVVQGPDLREPGKLYSFSFPEDRCG